MGEVPKQSVPVPGIISCVFLILQDNTKVSFSTPIALPDRHQLECSPDCTVNDDDDDVENWRSNTLPLTQSSGYHSSGMSEEIISEAYLESDGTNISSSNNVASYTNELHHSTTNGMLNICWHLPVAVCSDSYNSHD